MISKLICFSVLTVSLFLLSSCPDPVILSETEVPDPALRELLEYYTGKTFATPANPTPANPVYISDLAAITDELRTDGYGGGPVIHSITNLKGLELCNGVGFLLLNQNNLSGPDANLDSIARMDNIDGLDMVGCSLQDLNFLTGISSLYQLKIWQNRDIGFSDLMGITATRHPNLVSLGIAGWDEDGDGSTDPVSATNWQQIVGLLASHGNLSDLSMLSFDMDDSMFTLLYDDIFASRLSSWRIVDFSSNSLTESSVALLANLPNLTSIILSNNPGLVDISWISNLINIRSVDFSNTAITDIGPLKALFDNGGFGEPAWWNFDIFLDQCPNLILTIGSANRDALDYLLANDVRISFDSP